MKTTLLCLAVGWLSIWLLVASIRFFNPPAPATITGRSYLGYIPIKKADRVYHPPLGQQPGYWQYPDGTIMFEAW